MVGQDKPYVPIHREPSLGVGPSLQDHKLGWPEGRAPVMVCLTVDTETSIGGAFGDPRLQPVGVEKRVFGKVGSRAFGIPLLMSIAEDHGLKLTFFVETLNRIVFGLDPLKRVVRSILDRGHDVQLHLHPNYRTFLHPDKRRFPRPDFMHAYSVEEQAAMLEDGVRCLEACGASRVVAFRAGCYGADETTLRAMKAVGLPVDGSYNAAHLGAECGFRKRFLNDVWCCEDTGVFELPVTCFCDRSLLRKRIRPMDINGTGFREMKEVLNGAYGAGMRSVVVVLHSFSFIKPYDVQYRKVRIRHKVIRRFRKLCAFLSENRDRFQVRPMGEWTPSELEHAARSAAHRFPLASPVYGWGRLMEQAWDRWV